MNGEECYKIEKEEEVNEAARGDAANAIGSTKRLGDKLELRLEDKECMNDGPYQLYPQR